MEKFETDVLIIGTGPTGATTALALAKMGVKAHMVSRWNWLADTPRAHITNQRTMEVFRDLGIEDQASRNGTPWELMGDTLFTTSLAGEELLRMRTWGTGDDRKGDYMKGSPCPLLDIIQPEIEPIIFRNAAAAGATSSFNTEFVSHVQDDEGVTSVLRNCLTGGTFEVRSKYLVGADGARSRVAEQIGLPIEGHMARAGTSYVIFNADLEHLVAHRPSVLHWIVSPAASFGEIGLGLLRAVRPWKQWIAGWGFDISKGDPDLSEDHLRKMIYLLLGDDTIPIEIVRSSVWHVNQAYATQYSKGRVFCAGDAVHRHPPSSGLGLNTCVQDAHNLAWKLAYVLKGYAGSGLLETYSDERAPVGMQIVLRANQSRMDYAGIKEVFNVPGAANPVAAGIARFKDPGCEGEAARSKAREALDLKNNEFNAQGVEMNQRYVSSAVIPDASAGAEEWRVDPITHLQPSSRPGAKIPHAWLVDQRGRKLSTLDVTGRGRMTVVTGLAGAIWAEAVSDIDHAYLDVVVIGKGDALDPYCDWARRREIPEGGAFIVRPDGVIAWRTNQVPSSRSEATIILEEALGHVLGVSAPAQPALA